MHDIQALEMIERCTFEIQQRETEIKHLRPKAQAYDKLCQVLDLATGNRLMAGDREADILYTLKREGEVLRKKLSDDKSKMDTRRPATGDEEPQPASREEIREALHQAAQQAQNGSINGRRESDRATTASADLAGTGVLPGHSRDLDD